mmetsp:Transcript_4764/g.5445  ORF Transcript_4764/g.5445 Transcript_4764/m.5445 type:complete len:294 (-) Transcript_4764:257-1138(-)
MPKSSPVAFISSFRLALFFVNFKARLKVFHACFFGTWLLAFEGDSFSPFSIKRAASLCEKFLGRSVSFQIELKTVLSDMCAPTVDSVFIENGCPRRERTVAVFPALPCPTNINLERFQGAVSPLFKVCKKTCCFLCLFASVRVFTFANAASSPRTHMSSSTNDLFISKDFVRARSPIPVIRLLFKCKAVIESFNFKAPARLSAPISSNLLNCNCKRRKVLFSIRASAKSFAPLLLILFVGKERDTSELFSFNAAAMYLAPASPMLHESILRCSNVLLPRSVSANSSRVPSHKS